MDISDIPGQHTAKRALEVAAAGSHSILLVGPPGSPKASLARRLPTILPALTDAESKDVASYSVQAGALSRPFRAPHHSISIAGLLGGGKSTRPGECGLAHKGVLFLDDLPEFKRAALEAVRAAHLERKVVLARREYEVKFPAEFQLVASMNPCPCGFLGDIRRVCSCSPDAIRKYRERAGVIDFDIYMEVHGGTVVEQAGEGSSRVRARVECARACAATSRPSPDDAWGNRVASRFGPTNEARIFLDAAIRRRQFSITALGTIWRVARTIADLEGSEPVTSIHLAEACTYQVLPVYQ